MEQNGRPPSKRTSLHQESSPDPERQLVSSSSSSRNLPTSDDAIGLLGRTEYKDPHHPIRWPILKKWSITTIYCLLQVFISMTSTSFIFIEPDVQNDLGGSTQIITLGQSLFIVVRSLLRCPELKGCTC